MNLWGSTVKWSGVVLLVIIAVAGCATTPSEENPDVAEVQERDPLPTFIPANFVARIHHDEGKYTSLFSLLSHAVFVHSPSCGILTDHFGNKRLTTRNPFAPKADLRALIQYFFTSSFHFRRYQIRTHRNELMKEIGSANVRTPSQAYLVSSIMNEKK